MTRNRWIAVSAAIGVLTAGGVAVGVTSGDDTVAFPKATTTTTESTTTTTTEPTTTTAPPPSTTVVTLPPGTLVRGSRGDEVQALQQRLRDLHFDPGLADGAFGQSTVYAVQAFQKLNGFAPNGQVTDAVKAALANPAPIEPLVPDGGATRVEVDLRRQVLFLYKDGALRLVSHVSTGTGKTYCAEGKCGYRAITPVGAFRFAWRYSGWRTSRLGKLYNPVYFTSSGIAIHGALSVPTYPASHGCVRIPMNVAGYFPSLVARGDPVYVTDGGPVGPPPETPTGPPPDDPPTTPGDDSTTTSTTSTTEPTTTTSESTTTTEPTTTTTTSTTLFPPG
jgi:peptidoglycan hydrolase-like protein with peptidoglycan-binding domain